MRMPRSLLIVLHKSASRAGIRTRTLGRSQFEEQSLYRSRHSEADIRKILGENTLRVPAAAEQASRKMQSAP
jgi:hypothetical protein